MPATKELIARADALIEAKKYQEVVDVLTDELLEERQSAELYTERARAYWFLREYEKQWQDCEQAIALNPGYYKVYNARGVYWRNKGEYDKAIEDFGQAIQLKPDDAVAYHNRGYTWDKKNEYDKAIDDYNQAIRLKPDNADAYYNRGLTWYYKKEYDKAIEDYNQVVQLKPDDALIYFSRGNVWAKIKEYDKAIEDFNQAIQLNPVYADAYNNRGTIWSEKKEYDKAIEEYNHAIQLIPDNADAYCNRGNAWINIKEYDKAIDDYTQAIQLNPSDAEAYSKRGIAWFYKKEYDKAIDDYTQAIQLKPDDAVAFNNRGVAWKNKKELKKATIDFEQAINIDATLYYPYGNFGDIYYEQEDYKRALIYYEQALAIKPNESWFSWRIDNIKTRLEKPIEGKTKADSITWFISNILKNIVVEEREEIIRKKAMDVKDYMDDIRLHTHINNPDPVVHYTKLSIAELFIKHTESNIRFYNVLYMNDPEEGKILFNFLDHKDGAATIKNCFDLGCQAPDGDNNVYLGSFLPAPDGEDKNRFSHEDELVLWRTYGKNENGEEAKGCSIVLNCDYFSRESRYMQELSGTGKDEKAKTAQPAPAESVVEKHPLYRVLYYDKKTGEIITNEKGVDIVKLKEDLEKFKKTLKDLIKTGKTKQEKDVIGQIVYRILSELRYFFKSADYSFENECRVIIYAGADNERVKIDEQSASPKKLFFDPVNKVQPHIRKIYIGPRVPNADAWKMYFDVALRKNRQQPELAKLFGDIKVLKSEQKFQ